MAIINNALMLRVTKALRTPLPDAVVSGGTHGRPLRVDFNDKTGRVGVLTEEQGNFKFRVIRPAPPLLLFAQDEILKTDVFPDDGRVSHTILRAEKETR
jgi:hypothetical protein